MKKRDMKELERLRRQQQQIEKLFESVRYVAIRRGIPEDRCHNFIDIVRAVFARVDIAERQALDASNAGLRREEMLRREAL